MFTLIDGPISPVTLHLAAFKNEDASLGDHRIMFRCQMVSRKTLLSATALCATVATAQVPLATVRAADPAPKASGVVLIKPYATVTPKEGTLNDFRLKALASVDAEHPLTGDPNLQTLSLFGREDLIAATSDDYQPTTCAPAMGVGDARDEIVKQARKTSLVIINESHERSEHRGFTTELLAPLRAEGYSALAIEALSNPEPGTPPEYYPSFMRKPSPAQLEDEDGYYLGEAEFGRLGRTAKRLDYSLVPYEAPHNDQDAKMSPSESIARREEAQATALAAWIGAHPGVKMIVHVGYHHATEVPTAKGDRWMATRLKAKTGIDPLTISQTTCRGGGKVRRLAVLPADEPAGTFDLVIDHPSARFARGRPVWRIAAGDMLVSIPAELYPMKGWRVIEARPEDEQTTAVPMDRVAIRPGEDIALMLPPGRYRLRAIDVQQEAKRETLPGAKDKVTP